LRISIADFRFGTTGALRAHLLKSTIANRKSKIEATRRRSRIRNVALQMHDLKRISNIAPAETLDRDHKERCRF